MHDKKIRKNLSSFDIHGIIQVLLYTFSYLLQVAVVSFDDAAVVDIPLRYDEHKCNLMKQLANMPTFNFGMTNAQAGEWQTSSGTNNIRFHEEITTINYDLFDGVSKTFSQGNWGLGGSSDQLSVHMHTFC